MTTELKHIVMPFFSVETALPDDNEYVLIHLIKDNWGDSDDPHGKRYWKVAKFIKGISEKERAALSENDERKKTYSGCDEYGNNIMPFCWDSFGPDSYFGQEVDVWARLPILEA